MRSLVQLLGSEEGRDFLAGRGIFDDRTRFRERLRGPAKPELASLAGSDPGEPVVVAAHQVQCDYPRSVTAKVRALRDLASTDGLVPTTLWLDMDRMGSNKLSNTITWPVGDVGIRLAPKRFRELEPRFVPVEQAQLEKVVAWLSDRAEPEHNDRVERLGTALLAGEPRTLAEASHALTRFLLHEHLGFAPPSFLVSELAGRGLLTPALDAMIGRIDDVIAVFNAAIEELAGADVDPQVRPLRPDYLPLRFSCPRDGTRGPLVHERQGTDHFAAFACRCGVERRFHLGAGTPSLSEVAGSGRWSTDVTLPVSFNHLVSGHVVGRSSALYGLVLNRVIEKVLGGTTVPMLVPPDLPEVLAADGAPDSLVYDCLTAP